MEKYWLCEANCQYGKWSIQPHPRKIDEQPQLPTLPCREKLLDRQGRKALRFESGLQLSGSRFGQGESQT